MNTDKSKDYDILHKIVLIGDSGICDTFFKEFCRRTFRLI